MMNRHTHWLAAALACTCLVGLAKAELYTSALVERHLSGSTPASQWQEGTTYAEVGDFSTPGFIVPFTDADGTGSIEGYARASADYGVLKAQSYLNYTDLVAGGDRESFLSSGLAQYTESVQVANEGFWAGTGDWHALILSFRLTGSVTTTGQIKPSIRVRGLRPGGEVEGDDSGYWEYLSGSWGWPAPTGDYDEVIQLYIDGYWGEQIDTGLSLEVSSNNTNLWDFATSGTCLLDFYATCELETIEIFNVDGDQSVAVFDADGNPISGGAGWSVARTPTIPEPATAALLTVGLLSLTRHRR